MARPDVARWLVDFFEHNTGDVGVVARMGNGRWLACLRVCRLVLFSAEKVESFFASTFRDWKDGHGKTVSETAVIRSAATLTFAFPVKLYYDTAADAQVTR